MRISIEKIGKDRVTIDFKNREALKQLTTSILMDKYKIKYWNVPENYLIPAYTMRFNYIKWAANLLSEDIDLPKVIDMYCGFYNK